MFPVAWSRYGWHGWTGIKIWKQWVNVLIFFILLAANITKKLLRLVLPLTDQVSETDV